MITRCRSSQVAALIAALALTGCGGAAPAAKSAEEEPLPSTSEETLDMIDRSENELRFALGEPVSRALGAPEQPSAYPQPLPGTQPPPPTGAPSPSPPAPPVPPAPIVQAEASKRPAADKDTGASAPSAASTPTNDPCSSACRALASMERATVHLCTLAGSADARCEGARARVQSARARVRAQCPSCAGD
jgi:hypothetical protein